DFFQNAAYGIMVHETGQLDRHALLSAMALADELSKTMRWSLLPIGRTAGQSELTRMAQATTGLPPPLDFRICRGQHDHASLDAKQRITDGDDDLLIWISSSTNPRPDWLNGAATLITIDANDTGKADHHIKAGIAGVDHPAIIDPTEISGFIALTPDLREATASRPPSVASILTTLTHEIRAALPPGHPTYAIQSTSTSAVAP
ncbi:MAG: hypothetical protein AAFR75_13250, partial [Pseudomonadota bacterium]